MYKTQETQKAKSSRRPPLQGFISSKLFLWRRVFSGTASNMGREPQSCRFLELALKLGWAFWWVAAFDPPILLQYQWSHQLTMLDLGGIISSSVVSVLSHRNVTWNFPFFFHLNLRFFWSLNTMNSVLTDDPGRGRHIAEFRQGVSIYAMRKRCVHLSVMWLHNGPQESLWHQPSLPHWRRTHIAHPWLDALKNILISLRASEFPGQNGHNMDEQGPMLIHMKDPKFLISTRSYCKGKLVVGASANLGPSHPCAN